jgi:WD40 repeat protein
MSESKPAKKKPEPKVGISIEPQANKWNVFKILNGRRVRKQLERERMLIRNEEIMKEDLERYLMEIEERHSWVAYQLRHINHQRMKRKETLAQLNRSENAAREARELEEAMKENGLTYFKGDIKGNKRWQNSAAKHLDFLDHRGAVYSCKISRCFRYILSCSEDKTVRLWNLSNAQCIRVYAGHSKTVNDCDFHPLFKLRSVDLLVLSGSGDGTLRLWNSVDSVAGRVIQGHSQAIYRCAFSPDGHTMVSCSEDKSVRTWCYPEGYLLFRYLAHTSPVTTVSFSPTGRYIRL